MADNDKYPTESGRRRFVKGVVASAALAGVGTGTAATIGAATSESGAGGGETQFFGIENVAGPAPRGMPQIPIRIDGEGSIMGVWPDNIEDGAGVMDIAGETYRTSWFQYCGVQTYPGVDPTSDRDNFFRSASSPPYQWQSEELSGGDKLNVEHFSDYQNWGNGIGRNGVGKPAMASWRSTDVPPQETLVIQVLRSPRIEEMVQSGDSEYAQWLEATTDQGFIAWLDKCTHFCCVPGFKAFADSAKFGAEDQVYCQCHQSVYDPFSIVQRSFVALPRPEASEPGEDSGSGDGGGGGGGGG